MNYTSTQSSDKSEVRSDATNASSWSASFLNQFMIELIRFFYRLIANNIPDRVSQSELIHESGWWVEIFTCEPAGLYYFGHFDTLEEAHNSQNGFVEDLLAEGINDVKAQLRFCQPKRLTVGV
jgi:hypothetical protein